MGAAQFLNKNNANAQLASAPRLMGTRLRAASVGARESSDVLRVPPNRAAMLVEALGDGADALAAGLRRSSSVHFRWRGRRSGRSAWLCDDPKVILPLGRSVIADAHPRLVPHRF